MPSFAHPTRRAAVRLGATAVAALACLGTWPAQAADAPVLRVSAIPDEAPTELQRKFKPLGEYLSQATGMKVVFTPVSDYAAVVESLATRKLDMAWLGGFTYVQARIRTQGTAIALGVSDETLQRWLTEFPDLQEAFDKGKERERQTLHDVLYDTATKGTGKDALITAMFLLKSRHGYREGEQEQQANRVNVTFNIPAAQPLDKFMVIDDGNNRAESLPAKLTRTS